MLVAFCLPIIVILLGLSRIFAKDYWWERSKSKYDAIGLDVNRPANWDIDQTLIGLFAILLGILGFLTAFSR